MRTGLGHMRRAIWVIGKAPLTVPEFCVGTAYVLGTLVVLGYRGQALG